MRDTWNDRDLPVLRAVVELYDERGLVTDHDVVGATGMGQATVRRALRALTGEEPAFFRALPDNGGGYTLTHVTGTAYRTVGAWPTPAALVDRLIAGIEEAAESAEDEETRGRLKRTAAYLGGGVRDIVVEVAASALEKGTGLG